MKVYDFEHHGWNKAAMDFLRSNTNGLPKLDEEKNTVIYNDVFAIPPELAGLQSPEHA